jgi:hypothetical protein
MVLRRTRRDGGGSSATIVPSLVLPRGRGSASRRRNQSAFRLAEQARQVRTAGAAPVLNLHAVSVREVARLCIQDHHVARRAGGRGAECLLGQPVIVTSSANCSLPSRPRRASWVAKRKGPPERTDQIGWQSKSVSSKDSSPWGHGCQARGGGSGSRRLSAGVCPRSKIFRFHYTL